LLGEIIRRQQALRVGSYSYQGPRNRRDPWVDPRIPVSNDSHLPIEEQQGIVQALIDLTKQAAEVRVQYQNANNVIEEMTYRSELETLLGQIEEDVRRVVDQKAITYVPAERRLHLEVIEPISTMRADLEVAQGGDGPTASALKELLRTMTLHINAGEHRLALNAFETIKGRLDLALKDPARRDLVQKIQECAQEAQILADFEHRGRGHPGRRAADRLDQRQGPGRRRSSRQRARDRGHPARRDRVHLPWSGSDPALLVAPLASGSPSPDLE
jgi:hypothetical protein